MKNSSIKFLDQNIFSTMGSFLAIGDLTNLRRCCRRLNAEIELALNGRGNLQAQYFMQAERSLPRLSIKFNAPTKAMLERPISPGPSLPRRVS